MNIRRFVAADMRTALQMVRDAHGPDAVILSNRRTDEGVEIVAASNYDEGFVQRALDDAQRQRIGTRLFQRLADIARFQAIAERNRLAEMNDPARLAREELAARRKRESEEQLLHYLDGLEPDPDDVVEDDEPEAEPDQD